MSEDGLRSIAGPFGGQLMSRDAARHVHHLRASRLSQHPGGASREVASAGANGVSPLRLLLLSTIAGFLLERK